jgi:hypothetical protein
MGFGFILDIQVEHSLLETIGQRGMMFLSPEKVPTRNSEVCVMIATENTVHRVTSSALPELLPLSRMGDIIKGRVSEYIAAEPYPHIVLDDFFDEWVLEAVLAEFPNPQDKHWILHDMPEEIKLQSKHEQHIPRFTRQLLYALNSATFLEFLEALTGINNLVGDPHFEGGGLHQIVRGGKLAIHADFNKHSRFNLDRRLNLLIYLNKGWKEEYGGDFELWDRNMMTRVKKVAPDFNRVVIFTTSRFSYHGHPDALSCPPEMTRKSLALYYYSNGGALESTGLQHTTLFQRRPGERVRSNFRHVARDLVPPILWRIASRKLGYSQE